MRLKWNLWTVERQLQRQRRRRWVQITLVTKATRCWSSHAPNCSSPSSSSSSVGSCSSASSRPHHDAQRSSQAAAANKYLLTGSDLRFALASIPLDSPDTNAFRETRWRHDRVPKDQLLLAVDCEMCATSHGEALTRVALVDATKRVLLDELVKPLHPIVDYRTKVSGITPAMLQDCNNSLTTIQDQFLELCPAQSILIGHSIENDLKALQIIHRRLIDTSVLFKHRKFPTFRHSLRFLASEFLAKSIQADTQGHCSVEDAVTALELVQLRLERPADYEFPVLPKRHRRWHT